MSTFSDLVAEQGAIGREVEQLIRNYKKDGPDRKTTISYFEIRLQRLNKAWSEFEGTDNRIRLLTPAPKDHDYFTKDYYTELTGLIDQYRNEFEQQLMKLRSVQADAATYSTHSQQSAPAGAGIIRKICATLNTLRRLFAGLEADTEEHPIQYFDLKLNTINDLWHRVEDLSLSLWENCEDPATLGYNEGDYISMEKEVERWRLSLAIRASNIQHASYQNESAERQIEVNTQGLKKAALPKITIPKFSGDYLQWRQFHDLYSELVHKQEIPNAQKFWYLTTSLAGEAAKLISHLTLTNDNYDIAWKTLNNRYDNKRAIVTSIINNMLMSRAISSNASSSEVRALHDITQEGLLALKNQNIDTSSWGPILLHSLLAKLDRQTRLLYEQSLADPRRIPSTNEFLEFLEARFQALEAVGLKEKPTNIPRSLTTTVSQGGASNCKFCNEAIHPIYRCGSFLQASTPERTGAILRLKFCLNCLRSGHMANQCTSRNCMKCNKKHHTLLHDNEKEGTQVTKGDSRTQRHQENRSSNRRHQEQLSSNKRHQEHVSSNKPHQEHVSSTQGSSTSTQPPTTLVTAISRRSAYVLLGTVKLNIVGGDNSIIECRAILDSGSQVNLITERLAKQLDLELEPATTIIEGIGKGKRGSQYCIMTTIRSRLSNFKTSMKAHVIPTIVSRQPTHEIDTSHWDIPENLNLADPDFAHPETIDLLIGAELYHTLVTSGQIRIAEELPVFQNTVFGWMCTGKIDNCPESSLACGVCTKDDEELNNMLARFWQLDDISQGQTLLTEAERKCEESFTQHTQRDSTGRFIVKIPFKEDPTVLGDSIKMATNRFLGLERRLEKHDTLKEMCVAFMREYEQLGHMKRINQQDIISPHYVVPHHCVIKPESTTTKLRVVFDASAKTSTGVSLNDIMFNGPVVQSELFTILMRFRFPRYVFTTDIEKMYRQIWIHPDHQGLQIIIWREDPNEKLQFYRLKTVTYGTRAAPYLATRCLKTLSTQCREQYPLGCRALEQDFYVDDGLTGANSLREAGEIKDQLIKLLGTAGLKPRKWSANHPQLLEGIPIEDIEVSLDFDVTGKSTKTLGLIWAPKSDQLCIRTTAASDDKITKRSISSELAKVFDPLGLVAPVTVKAKIFIQHLWQLKLDWDEELSTDLHKQWRTFRDNLSELNNIKVPRHVFNHKESKGAQIHVFTDASERAYGAAIYIRSSSKDGTISMQLLCSKSRVSPLKTQTIPRLELCAALLGAQLVDRVKRDLGSPHKVYMWTDSEITLHWINSEPSNFQTFVSHRICKIQELTLKEQWRHVNTKQNPADYVSRGIEPGSLGNCSMWFYGPMFLYSDERQWPAPFRKELSIGDETEIKKTLRSLAATTNDGLVAMIYKINHRNSFNNLLRVVGYILRFISNAQRKCTFNSINISPKELDEALVIVIKAVQLSNFNEELSQLSDGEEVLRSSALCGLSPFLDSHNIIRVGGRLTKSNLSFDAKHPMLLPYNDPIAKLIMLTLHEKGLHCSPQALLAQTRQRFWPIKGKSMARSIVQHCVRCTRARPKMLSQVMGNLPRNRVIPERPFFNSGVDFCGPIWIHYKIRGKRPCKAYIAVFCCFTTKAVHLELVSDLTTEAFLGALNRLTSRRGRCKNLYCDNATNFVGAKNQLSELKECIYDSTAQNKITRSTADQGITFNFIPSRSPHFGGLWEAAVKSAKYLLIRSIGSSSLTYEELETVVIQIEAMLNSRPITPLSSNPNDLSALTPGHFLIGEPITAPPNTSSSPGKLTLSSRWSSVNRVKQEFWDRWATEYLNELQNRAKWKQQSTNVEDGMMVIMKEDNIAPFKWPLGRIIKKYPGNDGNVRVVDVKTERGVFKRAVHQLAPLPTEAQLPETPSKRRRISGGSTLMALVVTLLILPIVLGSKIQNTQFGSKVGVHFEGIGSTAISATEWQLLIYYDLESYWAEVASLSNGTRALRHLCQETKQPRNCIILVEYYERIATELTTDSMLFTERRHKRGAVNFVGNIAHSLFGVLDSEYAEQMSKTITQVRENEIHILNLLKNQTSVVDSTINIVKEDQTASKAKFDQLDLQISQIFNRIRNEEEEAQQSRILQIFMSLSAQLTLITTNLQRMQASILDVLTDTHHGKISPLLLTPSQLHNEVLKIKSHLPSHLELPVSQEDLLRLYKLMKAKGGLTPNQVVFSVTLPLVDHDRFELFNVIPIPNWTHEILVEIDPCTSILAINAAQQLYFPMSVPDLQACIRMREELYLCSNIQIRYGYGADLCACEINIFNNDTKPDCKMRQVPNNISWYPLQHKNQWIYATGSSTQATAVCDKEITQLDLMGSGILQLQPECVLKQNFMSVQGHQLLSSSSKASYTGLGNFTEIAGAKHLKPVLAKIHGEVYTTQVGNLTHLQNTLRSQGVFELPHKLETQNYHHIAVGYTALVLALCTVIYIICKICCKKTRINHPIPKPRRPQSTSSTSDFTVHI